MEHAKITILMENESAEDNLAVEHGLSLLIESGGYKILFDAGQSSKLIDNAKVLGVRLDDVDYLVLSHGHYDHTGGVEAFVNENSKAKILYKNGLFAKRYNKDRYIGVPFSKKLVRNRSMIMKSVTEIVPGVFVVPEIEISNYDDTHFNNLYIKKGFFKRQDTFCDELFMVVKNGVDISVITGCAHRGITNIAKTAMERFNGCHIKSLIGGFHLSKETEETKRMVCSEVEKLSPKIVYPMHCTGTDSMKYLKNVEVSLKHGGDIIHL